MHGVPDVAPWTLFCLHSLIQTKTLLRCGDDCRKGVAWASVPVVGVCACVVRSFLVLGLYFASLASEFLVTTSIYKTK